MDIMYEIQKYFNLVRSSSDPIIVFGRTALITLIMFILVRYLIMGDLFRSLRQIDREANRSIRKHYKNNIWVVWLFFMAGLLIIEVLTIKPMWIVKFFSFEYWFILAVNILFAGLFAQLYIFCRSAINYIKQKKEIENN